jgi:hypothetical protein
MRRRGGIAVALDPASMKRRALLTLSSGAAAFGLVGCWPSPVVTADAHEGPDSFRLELADLNPDRMWPVYRRYHLLIVGQRDDERSSAFTAAVVDVLSHYLPSSRPQLVSAADARRIGVLIATDQQDVAIMQAESAEALFLAKPPFADIPEAPLRIIVSFGSHVLVCRPNFMARHAFLLAKTLAEHPEGLPAPAVVPGGVVPAHRGSHAFFAGEEIPND